MNTCSICDEPITNPICPKCIAKSLRVWLMQNNPDLIEVVDDKLNMFMGLNSLDSDMHCIKCGGEMSICMYCFTETIYDDIKESNDAITIKTFPFKL